MKQAHYSMTEVMARAGVIKMSERPDDAPKVALVFGSGISVEQATAFAETQTKAPYTYDIFRADDKTTELAMVQDGKYEMRLTGDTTPAKKVHCLPLDKLDGYEFMSCLNLFGDTLVLQTCHKGLFTSFINFGM